MCARLANLCVRMFVQLYKHVCVYLYNVYACVRTLGQADGSSREDFAAASEQQLLRHSRGIIAMQPRCGCASVKTLMETDFFRFFLPTYIIVTIAMQPLHGSASV